MSVRLHFTNDHFDYFQYNGKSRTTIETFDLRKDKYSFHRIARMYDEGELPYFYAVNFFHKDKNWISELLKDEAKQLFKDWKNWQSARAENFNEDLNKLKQINFGAICFGAFRPDFQAIFQNPWRKHRPILI